MENFEFLKEITEPIFYVTNDVAKGIGLEKLLPNYHIICLDDHPLVGYLLKSGIKVFCLEKVLKQKNVIFRSSGRIIDHPLVLEYIQRESQRETPIIMFFKPSAKIDFVCRKNGFVRAGNSVKINRLFEEKVEFYDLCLREKLPVVEGETGILGNLNFGDLAKRFYLPLVIQFGRGWAGSTTYFIKDKEQWVNLVKDFSFQKVKVTRFVFGKTILNNACVYGKQTLVSFPAIQINAVSEFTGKQGATCGRQWPAKITSEQENQINLITGVVGRLMGNFGYKGFFGLDFLIEEKTGKVYLSENNARLTASVPFFTKLELSSQEIPLLYFHLAEFLGIDLIPPIERKKKLIGSEVVVRNNLTAPVKVTNDFLPGTYCNLPKELKLMRKNYFSENLLENELWLSCAAKGRKVNPEVEIIRADFGGEAANEKGNLKNEVKEILLGIKSRLGVR